MGSSEAVVEAYLQDLWFTATSSSGKFTTHAVERPRPPTPAEHWLSATTRSFASTGQIRRTHGSSITCIRPQNQPRPSLQIPRPAKYDTAAR